MPMSAQKGLHRVLLSILSPLMCSEKGNHLEAAGMGVGVPNLDRSLLPFQRVLLCMSVPYFMVPQLTLELPLLLSISSPQVTPSQTLPSPYLRCHPLSFLWHCTLSPYGAGYPL